MDERTTYRVMVACAVIVFIASCVIVANHRHVPRGAIDPAIEILNVKVGRSGR
jgi:hypothetical protein